jgi:N-glycosylase/DNA lyase
MPELSAPVFLLEATLRSGQAFRWRRHGDAWRGVLGRGLLTVRQDGARLLYEASDASLTPEAVSRYFALDLDLPGILRQIDVDMQIHAAIVRFRGLRVLRQDAWETLASFICASFNNIKRIEGLIERLCQEFGTPLEFNGWRSFSFPDAETLAGAPERRLRALGLGYRAPYLRATAHRVADGRLPLRHLRQVEYAAAKRALMGCEGVGDKVADCVALFGCEHYEAFPIDVWMARALRYYFRHRRVTRGHLHAYATRHFGRYAGYAQQYLYHHVRHLRAPQAHARAAARPSAAPACPAA